MDIQRSETPLLRRRNTIESVQLLMAYNVLLYTKRILNLPTLMLEAEGDDLTLWDPEIEAFNQIPSPEIKLFVNHETSHMKLYSSRSKLEITARGTKTWLAEHMINLRK
jgi:hypothetical protein